MDELLAEFVAETREMLEASEGEIIAWEADPADRARLDTIFRFVHTVKGNCGFFDFPRLAALSHAAEDALADCRAERRTPDRALVSAVLAIIDRIVQMVDAIEAGEDFPEGGDEELIAALEPGEELIDALDAATTAPSDASDPTSVEVDAKETDSTEANKNSPPSPKPDNTPQVQRSIRLPVDLLDRVMSGVSDMVLARNDLAHRLRQAGTQPTIDGPFERLTSILSDVRDAITRMRMQRIEMLFSALPRLVRDLSSELGKQVIVDIEGGDVELDREMIETIRDPLTHLIRNAVDHGIESPSDRLASGKREIGILSISARQSGNTISIVVSDDGRGLNEEKIADKALSTGLIDARQREKMSREKILQLIFEPGFSTAETVSNVSGRGVGLDVVRDNLERVGGSIKVSSTSDVGTLFTLQVPLTLSIIAGLTVEAAGQRFGIPQSYIEEIIHASSKALDYTEVGDTALVTFRGQRVPCLMLSNVLGLEARNTSIDLHTMVILRLASGDQFALAVDDISHHGDLVIKPLAPAIMKSGLYAGSTLLDDGQPILLLDVTNIAGRYDMVSDARTRVRQTELLDQKETEEVIKRVMLFTDWRDRRCAVRLELVQRIETAPASVLDRSTGSARAVIDGVILPVIGLPDGKLTTEKVRFLRMSDGVCELLFAVRQVNDAAELSGNLKPVPDDPLIEGVTLIDDATVLLMDGHELFAKYGEPPEAAAKPICQLPDNDWARTILAPLVKSAGYDVATEDECDVTIVFEEEYDAARELDQLPKGPVIRLRSQPDPSKDVAAGDDPTVYRYDRDGVLAALKRASRGGKSR
ncbi:chemotaxis protein CheA [Erythrobacter sp. YT30]|uniref:chemotaxis protein CheA n=1 Tax=Erythrobacter sp. YT30 TaxID=1735012 RepID=UPI00076C9229|nr:chemotaxis protein CheA [Erythrobacter sp. YT30]KWV91016.1 chemotaxis protein CheA [Erythrobacter sp. YT30]